MPDLPSIPVIDISPNIRKTECMFKIREFLNNLKIGENEYESYDAYIGITLKDEDDKKEFLKKMEEILKTFEPQTQH